MSRYLIVLSVVAILLAGLVGKVALQPSSNAIASHGQLHPEPDNVPVSEGLRVSGHPETASVERPSPLSGAEFESQAGSYIEYVASIDEFAARHGSFSEPEMAQYVTYPDSVLDDLAISGDLMAMEVLARRAIAMGERELAMDIYSLSAVYGGTAGLSYIALQRFYDGVRGDRLTDKKSVLDAFSFLELALLRGNLNALRTGLYLVDRHSLEFSQDELDEISAQAQTMYSEYEAIRQDFDLPPYDNALSLPMLLAIQEDFPLSKNPTGWGARYYR